MGRRHVTKGFKILDGVDISTDQAGSWSDVSQYDNLKYLVNWSGDAAGELILETSDDKTDIHELDFGETLLINDGFDPKQHTILVNLLAHSFLRIRYVSTSGSGSMNASIVMSTKGA